MKKQMVVPDILPDSRTMAAYDREVGRVGALLVELRNELTAAGYDATDMAVLSAAFVPGWLEEFERGKLAGVDSPARVLLEDMAVAKIAPLAARIDDIRIQIAGAGFVNDSGEACPLNLVCTDIERVDGELKVKAERRARFIAEHTRVLSDDEARAYIEFADILPRLQDLKNKGFAVCNIVEGRVGRAEWQKGVEGVQGLEYDVTIYKFPKTK